MKAPHSRPLLRLLLAGALACASLSAAHADTRIIVKPNIVIQSPGEILVEPEAYPEPYPEPRHRTGPRHRHHPVREGRIGVRWLDSRTVRVSHPDLGWSGRWNYVCFNGNCYPGNRRGGYYYRDFAARYGEYSTEFKVQDDGTGQYITQGGGYLD